MAVPRIFTALTGFVILTFRTGSVPADESHATVSRTTCECRDGVWQWVTENVPAPRTSSPTAANESVRRLSAEEFAQLLRRNEPFDGIRFRLEGPGNQRVAADRRPEDPQPDSAQLNDPSGRERHRLALRDGRLIDLLGTPIRVEADGRVANAQLFEAAELRLEGPAVSGPSQTAVTDRPRTAIAAAPDNTAAGSVVRRSAKPQWNPWADTVERSGRIAVGPTARSDDPTIGVEEPEINNTDPAGDDSSGDTQRARKDSRNPANDWSVLPGNPGAFPSILFGIPGQGSYPEPGLSGTASRGGRTIPRGSLPLGFAGGGGISGGGGGGGGGTPPVNPPVDPPQDPPINPPTDPPVIPPVDPPQPPPVNPPVDPPHPPPADPPVDPPQAPPVDPPIDPPHRPPVDPPIDPPIVCIPEIPQPEIPPEPPEIPDDDCNPVPELPVPGSPSDTPVVPEPGSLVLLILGGSLGGGTWLRRRRKLMSGRVG